jgi:hypothetical protein
MSDSEHEKRVKRAVAKINQIIEDTVNKVCRVVSELDGAGDDREMAAQLIHGVVAAKYLPTGARYVARQEFAVLGLYKERGDGVSKAEFVRRLIELNKTTVPEEKQRGISGTNFKNVYRELNRLLDKDGGKTD